MAVVKLLSVMMELEDGDKEQTAMTAMVKGEP